MKKHIKILLPIIFIAYLIVFYINLDFNYELRGDKKPLLSINNNVYDISLKNYEMIMNENNFMFKMTGDDPQIIIEGLDEKTGGIEIVFSDADIIQNDTMIQVFYAQKDKDFSEKYSAKGYYSNKENIVRLPVKYGNYDKFRIDIDSDFSLEDINIYNEKPKSHPYISNNTIYACKLYFPVIFIGFILIYWAHYQNAKKRNLNAMSYIKSIFTGYDDKKDRLIYLDYLRMTAAILVILIHTCSFALQTDNIVNWKRFILLAGLSLGECSNVLFVMLSGTLLLWVNNKEEKLSSFYIRRASKVVIPLICYYIFALVLSKEISILPPENLGGLWKRIISGAPDAAPHFWLAYLIIGFYIGTPFIKNMMINMSDKMVINFAILIFVMNAIYVYVPLFGFGFGSNPFFVGWLSVFLLGYIIMKIDSMGKLSNINIIVGAAFYILILLLIYNNSSANIYLVNFAPTMMFVGCGIYTVFLKNKDFFANKNYFIVKMISKYNFSIMLIHWYVLSAIVNGRLHITALRFGCIGGIPVTVLTTLIICLFFAIVFDNTVVIVADVLFNKIVNINYRKK